MTAQERFNEAYEELGYVTDQAAPVTLEQVKFAAVNLERERQGMSVRRTAEALGVGKSKIYGILARAGRSFAVVALLVLVVGCSTTKNEKQSHQMPMPPLPRTARSSAGAEVNNVARAVAPPAQPRTIKLEWTKGDEHPETVTQVWQSQTLQDWTLYGEFADPRCEVPATEQQMFFKIRNRLGSELSDWARK